MQYVSPFAQECGSGGPMQPPAQEGDLGRFAMSQRVLGLGHCCAICAPFMQVEPLVRTAQGTRINPLFDTVRQFRLAANPFPLTVPAGETMETTLLVQAEENHMGDLLISELLADTTPVSIVPGVPGGRFAISMQNMQNDRFLSNAPVLDRFLFANGQLYNTLPCCLLIQATNFAQFRVQNITAAPATLSLVARGQRFLPYMYPHLREQMLAYWNTNRTIPYYLTIDLVQEGTGIVSIPGGGVTIPAGATATVFATVPGAGDFEAKEFMCDVVPTTVGVVDAGDILAFVQEGVGRAQANQPIPLDMLAQQNFEGAAFGFQGRLFRPASGGHGKQFTQFFKRNTRMRITLQNTSGVSADVRICWRGCAHYYDDCEPGDGLNRSLSLEPSIGPMIAPQTRCPPLAQFGPIPGQGMRAITGGFYPQPPPTGQTFPPPAFRGGSRASPYFPPGAYAPPRLRAVEPADGGYPPSSFGRW